MKIRISNKKEPTKLGLAPGMSLFKYTETRALDISYESWMLVTSSIEGGVRTCINMNTGDRIQFSIEEEVEIFEITEMTLIRR